MKNRKNIYQQAFEVLKEQCASYDTVDELITLKELVEKSVPTYVKAYRDGVGDATVPNGTDDFFTYECPNCEEEIPDDFMEPEHCPFCGQCLRWYDEENEE